MADENKNVRLEVRSRNDRGFRREGRLWTPDPVEESFTEEAAQRLLSEPQLIVRRLDGGSSEGATGATGATGPVGSPNIADNQPSGVKSGSSATDTSPFASPHTSTEPTPDQPAPAKRR